MTTVTSDSSVSTRACASVRVSVCVCIGEGQKVRMTDSFITRPTTQSEDGVNTGTKRRQLTDNCLVSLKIHFSYPRTDFCLRRKRVT